MISTCCNMQRLRMRRRGGVCGAAPLSNAISVVATMIAVRSPSARRQIFYFSTACSYRAFRRCVTCVRRAPPRHHPLRASGKLKSCLNDEVDRKGRKDNGKIAHH